MSAILHMENLNIKVHLKKNKNYDCKIKKMTTYSLKVKKENYDQII